MFVFRMSEWNLDAVYNDNNQDQDADDVNCLSFLF